MKAEASTSSEQPGPGPDSVGTGAGQSDDPLFTMPPAFEQSIELFMDYVRLECGHSDATIRAYASDLQAFARHVCPDHSSPRTIVRRDLVQFLAEGKSSGLAPATLSRRLVVLRVFFRYLVQEGLIQSDPAAVLESANVRRILPDVLGEEDIQALLDAPNTKTTLGGRDRAILECMYACGLRVSEVVNLRMGNLDVEQRLLRVTGKGNKQRLVPIGSVAQDTLVDYMERIRPKLLGTKESAVFFLSRNGRPLSRQDIWTMIKRMAATANLPATVSPHALRHAFATHLLSHGAPLRLIQEMLGHADIGTTQIYTFVDAERLQRLHTNFHPRG